MISLLANEDVEPQTIIPSLKRSLRMKVIFSTLLVLNMLTSFQGLFIGNWFLEGSTIYVRDLTDPSGGNARYTFQMTLTLESKPLGRYVQTFITYWQACSSIVIAGGTN